MSHSETSSSGPWYRHFWPWFVVGLLGVSMVASLATVVVAFGLGNLELPAEPAARTPSNAVAPVERD